MYNQNGDQFSDLVTPIANSYLKEGAVQDTAYWSENQLVRLFTDTKVTLVLARPSLSNSYSFKAGSEIEMRMAVVQQSGVPGQRAFGEAYVKMFIV